MLSTINNAVANIDWKQRKKIEYLTTLKRLSIRLYLGGEKIIDELL